MALTYMVFLLVESTHITTLPSESCACTGQVNQQLALRAGCKFVVYVKQIVSFLVRKRQPAADSNNDQQTFMN